MIRQLKVEITEWRTWSMENDRQIHRKRSKGDPRALDLRVDANQNWGSGKRSKYALKVQTTTTVFCWLELTTTFAPQVETAS